MFPCFSPKNPNLSLEPYQSVMAGKIHQAVCIPYEMMRKKTQSLSKVLSCSWGAYVRRCGVRIGT